MVALHSQIAHFYSHLFSQNKNLQKSTITISANSNNNKKKDNRLLPPQNFNFTLKLSKTLLARSAIAVFGLGFIDAGYSGDWSRIGVISKEIEDYLKLAAFLVVPFCLFLIFYYISRDEEKEKA